MRFKLKTEFLSFARDQIRGGIWYKPAWWEAVTKVPPPSTPGRVRKDEIPRIRFVEDRLVREFTARNPQLKRFDERNVARKKAPDTVVKQFVREQLKHMRRDTPEEAAYKRAQAWLITNGRKVLGQAAPGANRRPSMNADHMPPVGVFQRLMKDQVGVLAEAITRAGRRGDGLAGRYALKQFMSDADRAALQARSTAASTEPAFPGRSPGALREEEERYYEALAERIEAERIKADLPPAEARSVDPLYQGGVEVLDMTPAERRDRARAVRGERAAMVASIRANVPLPVEQAGFGLAVAAAGYPTAIVDRTAAGGSLLPPAAARRAASAPASGAAEEARRAVHVAAMAAVRAQKLSLWSLKQKLAQEGVAGEAAGAAAAAAFAAAEKPVAAAAKAAGVGLPVWYQKSKAELEQACTRAAAAAAAARQAATASASAAAAAAASPAADAAAPAAAPMA